MENKINPVGEEEVVFIKLSEIKHPVAFNKKVEELIASGLTKKEAIKFVQEYRFCMELYYEKGLGLMMVESEVIENSCDIFSPYSGKKYNCPKD